VFSPLDGSGTRSDRGSRVHRTARGLSIIPARSDCAAGSRRPLVSPARWRPQIARRRESTPVALRQTAGVPDVRSLDVRGWLARHERFADVVLMLLVFLLLVQPLLRMEGCGCAEVGFEAYALVVAECLPLVWRRRWPFAVAAVVGLLAAVHGVTRIPDGALPYAAAVAFYTLAAHGSRRSSVIGAGLGAVVLAVVLTIQQTGADSQDVTVLYLVFATAWLLGDGARSRREKAVELEARMVQAEQTRAAQAERAVADERARIAREMHDVVAHHVSMMVVQAEAGPVVVHRDPDRASQVFDSISATGKQALTEMRRLLGVRLTGQFADGLFTASLFSAVFFNPERATSAGQAAAPSSWRISRKPFAPGRSARMPRSTC